MIFDLHIGIDYSGAQTPSARLAGLQVYIADRLPERVASPADADNKGWNWTRREIAEWLIAKAKCDQRFIVGIDHGFSFPVSYLERYGITSWSEFLEDFVQHWPTHEPNSSVDLFRDREEGSPDRSGSSTDFRLTEKWTSSAKSVFKFDVQGSVAKSTHTGIPWLRHIRRQVGDCVHFWPFDGWQIPADKNVIAEVYPSLVRNRYLREDRTPDQQDAYAIAYWLAEMDERGFLKRYFDPPLTEKEKTIAEQEGWILGVM